ALFYHSFGNRPIDRDEAEFIPTFVNHDIGHADSIPGHDIASYLGCVGLPAHAASVDRSDVYSFAGKVFTQEASLLVAEFRTDVVVVARSSLRVTNEIDVGHK